MNTNVNLVPPKSRDFLAQQKRAKIVNTIAISFPIIVGVVSLIIFLITQAVNPVSIKKQQEETIRKITKLEDRKIKLFIVNDRLNNISQLLKEKRNFADNISAILSNIPTEAIVEDFEINNDNIMLTASSVSLRSIDELINNLIVIAEKKEVVRSLFLDSLIFERNKNSYSVSLKLEI